MTQSVIDIEGRIVPIRVRINSRAKRLIVRVEPTDGEVVVVAPNSRSVRSAIQFANDQSSWIKSRLEELPKAIAFKPGQALPLRGETHTITHDSTARRGVWQEDGPDGKYLYVSGQAEHVARRVQSHLKSLARKDLRERVRVHCASRDSAMPRVTIRDTATRWGSCSSRSGLSFSWRLILAPPFVLNYVAAHEVAHLEYMNHTQAFWDVVLQLVGDYEPAHTWLKAHGPSLHRYGR